MQQRYSREAILTVQDEFSGHRADRTAENAFTLGDAGGAIAGNKLLVLVMSLLGAGAGFALATQVTPTYTAASTLLSDASMSRIVDMERGDTAPLVDPSATATIVETIGTPVVIDRAIERLSPDIQAELEEMSAVEPDPDAEPVDPAREAEETRQRMVRHVLDNLDVSNSGRSYVITVYYTSPDPLAAAEVANSVTGAYLAYRTELRQEAYRQYLDDLGREISELQEEMQTAERTAQTMRERVRLLALRSEALIGAQQDRAIEESAELFAGQREAEREADVTAEVYASLLRSERAVQSRLSRPVLDVRLFAPAPVPLEPSGLDIRPVLVFLGLMGGLFVGAIIAMSRSRRKRAARPA